mmetsp:Transcript_5982/g.13623  ORF Transcript_5982/g.13623 Transcript_5982/m.13623 type:complete len:126 (-) Transcript_5982:52-429(-)
MRGSLLALADALKQPRVRKAAVEVTDAAAQRIKELLETRHKPYLRFGVKRRGCSGLSYTINYADDRQKFDELVEEKGVRILIEPTAVMHLLGTRIDYHTDKLRSEFTFTNPQAKGTCGCGESFTT